MRAILDSVTGNPEILHPTNDLTISRVISENYLNTPRGGLELDFSPSRSGRSYSLSPSKFNASQNRFAEMSQKELNSTWVSSIGIADHAHSSSRSGLPPRSMSRKSLSSANSRSRLNNSSNNFSMASLNRSFNPNQSLGRMSSVGLLDHNQTPIHNNHNGRSFVGAGTLSHTGASSSYLSTSTLNHIHSGPTLSFAPAQAAQSIYNAHFSGLQVI